MSERKRLADNPKEALEELLRELDQEYYPWYEKSVSRIHWTWLPLHVASLFGGFTASILAALATEKTFAEFGWLRVLIVALPAVSAAASTVTAQSRLRDWCRFRENGRRAMQALYNEGRGRFASAKLDEEYSSIYSDIEAKITKVEKEQGTGWFLLSSPPSTD